MCYKLDLSELRSSQAKPFFHCDKNYPVLLRNCAMFLIFSFMTFGTEILLCSSLRHCISCCTERKNFLINGHAFNIFKELNGMASGHFTLLHIAWCCSSTEKVSRKISVCRKTVQSAWCSHSQENEKTTTRLSWWWCWSSRWWWRW